MPEHVSAVEERPSTMLLVSCRSGNAFTPTSENLSLLHYSGWKKPTRETQSLSEHHHSPLEARKFSAFTCCSSNKIQSLSVWSIKTPHKHPPYTAKISLRCLGGGGGRGAYEHSTKENSTWRKC